MDNKSSFFKPTLTTGLLLACFFSQAETTETQQQAVETETTQTQQTDAAETEQNTVEQLEPYNRYVTERLYIFIHTGASTRYRIIGRAAAGEELKVIARDTETGWLQIEQANGKTGWVDNSQLVNNAGAKGELKIALNKITDLEQQLTAQANSSSEEALAQLNSEVGSLTIANEELTRQLDELKQQNAQIDVLKAKNIELENSVVDADQKQKMLDKLYDAGTVLLGVFVGWLITRRRKSNLSFDRL